MNIKSVKKVAIIGVGFMGGSLAYALRRKFPSMSVWGYARSQASYNKLKRLKVLNRIEQDLESVVKDADLVVLGLPIYAIVEYLKKILPYLKKGAIVFDLGSSKELIEKKARRILPQNVDFVGCHPLCGSEKSGAEFSRKNLYKEKICLITSSAKTRAVKTIKSLWESLGSQVIFISPSRHDRILSSMSHMPHLISFSLTHFIPSNYLKFTLPSLKDLTRISGSPACVWADILISNKKNVLRDTDKFIRVLKEFEKSLKEGNRRKIFNLIKNIQKKRSRIQAC